MSAQSQLQNFQQNLRYLCGYHRSVAEVCRKLAINRQQFNKYLAGANMPSDYNMRKICQFFEVEAASLLAPHTRFLAEYEGHQATLAGGGTSTNNIMHGAMAGPGTFYYQVWFRNTPAMYCTPDAFNLSNAIELAWP